MKSHANRAHRQLPLPLTVFAFALLFFLGGPGRTLAAEETETLRVLTYNIHMWQIGVKDLAEVIRSADADVVGLNEAWSEKQNEAIAKELGFNIIYGGQNPARETPNKPHTVNGFYMPQVLLTRHKIVESHVFNAMAAKEHERFDPEVPIYRGGVLAVLETKRGTRFAVFVLHLHPWGDGDNEKMTSMRLAEIQGILKKLKPYKDLPTLVIGDFNTRSHLDEPGGWKVTRHLADQGYTDLYRTIHPDPKTSPGLTCGKNRIDYIFANRHVKPVESKVLTSGVFKSRGYEQSDHLGLLGEVQITPVAD
jgi:endonuclease/exonuclease/phosphatase family metal-dependent hydrolase